jgi:hexosaminidase
VFVEPTRVVIGGANQSGQFSGIQSLLQLIDQNASDGNWSIPALKILDRPRFPYRGMHLDVSRHFEPVEFVKKFIDLMAQYKFNYFHWHLTDDQGWRIEIKKYPKLTEIGSTRPETMKERNFNPYIGDGIPHGGFYTQEQIKDVVAYAKARYITVIPEIEMPGHASAALAAYPQFGCKADFKYKVQTTWGIFKEVFCPTDETFKFLEDVLDETIKLFPDSPYIHIGGDEVLKDHWKESAFVQDLMKRENLKDEHEVQSYFIRRVEKFINSRGKKIIGWDKILEGGVAPNATIMSWRGEKGGIEAAKAKHDVVMTPNTYVYFDYGQGDPATEPLNIGSFVPLEKVYSYDPVPKDLSDDEAKYILGGQANIWTEYLKTPEAVEYMAFPRMLALSEVLWSKKEDKNFDDFSRRLAVQLQRLDKQNVNYRIPAPAGLTNAVVDASDGKVTATLKPFSDTAKVYFTLDGSTPDEKSTAYEKPIEIDVKDGQRVDLKTVTILPNGRKSSVYTATYIRRPWYAPVDLAEKRPGVTYAFVRPGPSGEPVAASGETRTFNVRQFEKAADLKQRFAVSYDGYFVAPTDGIYEFQLESAWDGTVEVAGEKLIDASGTSIRSVRSEVIALKSGLHKLHITYNSRGGEPMFNVRWAIKGQNWRGFGATELVH